MDPAPYQHAWHLEAVAEHLEAVAFGDIRKLCINMPPRHSKTLLTSVCFNAWLWAREPDDRYPLIGPASRFMCLSYAENLAMDNAILTRRLVGSEWFKSLWGDRVQLTTDQANKHKFDTSAGGTRISGSFSGTITGRGASVRVYDDPHKMDEVESQTVREGVLKIYDTTLKSRVTDPRTSAEVLVAQRGHQDDLSNKFLSDPEVVHLNLPAEYDATRHCVTVLKWDKGKPTKTWEDPRKHDGELLWPLRWGPKELAPYKKNTYEWSAQWQQMPVPRGGGLFKDEWWQVHEVIRQKDKTLKFVPSFSPIFVVAGLDTAFSENEQNDYSALVVWAVYEEARTGHRRIMLVDAWKKQLAELHGVTLEKGETESEGAYIHRSMPKWGLVEWVAHTCTKRRVDRLLVENKTRGHDVVKEIKRLHANRDWSVRPWEPKGGDKWTRAHSIVDLFTDDMIYAPATITESGNVEFLEWAQMVQVEMGAFPKGAHDDIVDAAVMGLKHLREIGMAVRKDEAKAEAEHRATHRPQSAPIYQV